ncbi:MAG: hypothetical protein WDZ76_11755 [Pseudohongiellaceae bacterium]
MAITAEARNELITMVVGMFGGAPGANVLTDLTNEIEAGATIEQLTVALASSPVFTGIYPTFLTTEEFAENFIENLVGDESAADDKAWAVDQVVGMLNAGTSRGQVVFDVIEALVNVDPENEFFGNAAVALQNKVEVATYYTVELQLSGDSLQELQEVIQDVDSTEASVEEAKENIEGGSGGTFTLTTGQDNLGGTSANDTFTGTYQDSNSDTLTLGDTIDGKAGNDTVLLFTADESVSVGGLNVSNVENLRVINSDDSNNFNTLNIANKNFDSVTLDFGEMNVDGVDINNVLSSSAVTLTNIMGGGEDHNVNFTTDSTSTAATHRMAVSDVDLSDNNEEVFVNSSFTVAESIDMMVNLSDIQGDDDFNFEDFVELDEEDVAVNLTLNVTDVASDENVNVNIFIDQAGDSVNTAEVNLTNTDNVFVALNTDDNNQGTSAEDVLTLNVDNVENSNDLSGFATIGFETINFNVNGDADFNLFEDQADDGNDRVINIMADADLTIANTVFDDNIGDVTVTITGAGDVDLGNASLGDNDLDDTVTIDGSAMTGGLTLANIGGLINTITTGSGSDDITVGANITDVDTGDGDDSVDTAGFNYGAAGAGSLDGGDGTDAIGISDGNLLNEDTADNISGFEVLDISNAGITTFDMSIESSLAAVRASTALGDVVIENAAADTPVSFSSFGGGFAGDTVVDSLEYILEDADGSDDSLSLSLLAIDVNKNSAAAGQMIVGAVTADEIEDISIASNVFETETLLTSTSYTNEVTALSADAVETLTLTGAADLEIGGVTAATLTKVDATAMTGQLTIALGATATSTVAVLGGSGGDTIDMTGNTAANNIIVGNDGGDNITLAAAGTKETIRYADDGDTNLSLIDLTNPPVSPVVYDLAAGHDIVTGFETGEDKIELSSALGLATGDARSAITGKGDIADIAAATLQTLIGDGVDFFNDGTTDRALAQATVNGATDAILFIDLNADGDFTNGVDGAISLVGNAGLVISDIVFG